MSIGLVISIIYHKDLMLIRLKKYNEILNDDKYKYYLYVDLVSYLKKDRT
ncbi:MAG: hypothetical protein L6V78_05430 [Clostridium sp.]|nr:MAG: hypothetical protein L6V78_05430 [Clostridium sp.]